VETSAGERLRRLGRRDGENVTGGIHGHTLGRLDDAAGWLPPPHAGRIEVGVLHTRSPHPNLPPASGGRRKTIDPDQIDPEQADTRDGKSGIRPGPHLLLMYFSRRITGIGRPWPFSVSKQTSTMFGLPQR
jgi:hypothetical protein